ncbi:MAG: RtcB family protein [Methylobacteriaceae bacterium]|nr:RtcB family protein [Methylobacteriaceae bacterium]MBV9704742.1 RtcB family protein [Methylobacteriaceae bacterium]
MTGKTLIALGYQPGKWFPQAIAAARLLPEAATEAELRAAIDRFAAPPVVSLRAPGALAHRVNVAPETAEEVENIAAVEAHMRELMRVPTIVAGAVMPDACPAGAAPGTIPVGGVAAAKEAIHPGMHSADICCSMAVSIFGDADPSAILDAGMQLSHFGGGGRSHSFDMRPPDDLLARFEANRFLATTTEAATKHFATQGDGNHFFFVGRVGSTGAVALVTHHGSRKPGALLYKAGMDVAERYRRELSPETPKHNAWIPSETDDGRAYWDALQIIRAWTKKNHFAIHDATARHLGLKVKDRFWNEHNFVFRKPDGLFYHAKGATPAWEWFADDSSGLTLIPLNMAEPILIARGRNAESGLGFAPHGAGRNFSRTAYLRRHAGKTEAEMVTEQTAGIDVRFFCGIPDVSELPLAYKNAAAMRHQIEAFGLADIVDTIEPIGTIMAGDWQRNAPWRKRRGATEGED